MKKIWLFPVLFIFPTLLMAANIQISAVKKTESQRTSNSQQIPGGSTQVKSSSEFYRFDVKCMDTQVPPEAEFQYVIVVEKKNGDLTSGARGRENIALEFGQTVSIEGDTVELSERTWDRDRGSGKVESEVYGYGARIIDSQGEVLAEKYSKSGIEDYLTDFTEQRTEEKSSSGEKIRERLQRRRLTRPPVRNP